MVTLISLVLTLPYHVKIKAATMYNTIRSNIQDIPAFHLNIQIQSVIGKAQRQLRVCRLSANFV